MPPLAAAAAASHLVSAGDVDASCHGGLGDDADTDDSDDDDFAVQDDKLGFRHAAKGDDG